MFIASRNWLAQHRRRYTNQSMIIDLNIQRLDRAIKALDPTQALPANRSIDFLYQSVGLKPCCAAICRAQPTTTQASYPNPKSRWANSLS